MPSPHTRRNLLVGGAAVAVALVVALVAVNLELFVWPSATGTVRHADAVVVLAGGDGERLDQGLELAHQGVASTLVASTGPERLCRADEPFQVICFLPDPNNTRGEVEEVARLAQQHGWKRLVLVTSTYHVTRARLLLDRCYSGSVEVVAARPDKGFFGWLGAIAHEWGGLAEALVRRSC
ncbi:MAG TPA: YdcF family protein [Acidimicrobiia bacterium]|nr:YdcF family protein [Acidimicrobiia bacterium]